MAKGKSKAFCGKTTDPVPEEPVAEHFAADHDVLGQPPAWHPLLQALPQLRAGGRRARGTGDYEPWTPD